MTHKEGPHSHYMGKRTELLITVLIGPLLLGLCYGMWGVSVRTRESAQFISAMQKESTTYQGRVMRRFTEMETRLQHIEGLQEEVSQIRSRVDADENLWSLIVSDNRDDHEEIKDSMKSNREEVLASMADMKKDLIREFHKSNGH